MGKLGGCTGPDWLYISNIINRLYVKSDVILDIWVLYKYKYFVYQCHFRMELKPYKMYLAISMVQLHCIVLGGGVISELVNPHVPYYLGYKA